MYSLLTGLVPFHDVKSDSVSGIVLYVLYRTEYM